jgi:leucine dehydrogenase
MDLDKLGDVGIFKTLERYGYEQVCLFTLKEVGLKAIIVIHNSTLGPALGGCRMWTYSNDLEAISDCLRLARGMTYKAAAAGLNLGGGKAVIIGDPRKEKSEHLFRAFGRYVETLNGRYITAEDVGTDVNDMEYAYMETRYVTGVTPAHGGSGDPSPVTAFGVMQGIRASVHEVMDTDTLKGRTVAVQGLGSVGENLVRYLVDEGAKITATDIDMDRAKSLGSELGIEIVQPDEIYGVDAEVFAPCALGAIINDDTVPQFKFRIIAGGANNQLAEDRHGEILLKKGILYAPDYVINAGGLINVYNELEGYNRERARRMTRGIYYNLRKIFAIANAQEIPTNQAADRLAEQRIHTVAQLKATFLGNNPGPTRQLQFLQDRRASDIVELDA